MGELFTMDRYVVKHTVPSTCSPTSSRAPPATATQPRPTPTKTPSKLHVESPHQKTPPAKPKNLASQATPQEAHTTTTSTLSTPKSASSTPASSQSTPKSANSRSAWAVVPLKMGKTIQIHIMCRRSNGRMGPYTSTGNASKRRPIWEPISECEYKVEKKGEAFKKWFRFKNTDNESAVFHAHLMDPLLTSVNQFTQKNAALLIKNPRILAAYFTLISCSEHFCNFKPDIHDMNGIKKDGTGVVEDDLVRLGGSLLEYEEFVISAVENVAVIGAKDEGLKISPATKKRKLTDYYNKSNKKMSGTEKTEQNYQQMVTEEGGMEKSVVSAYVKHRSIPLEKLSVSPQLFLPINQVKVNEIAESMMDRLEVSQLVVSVIPVDLEKFEREGEDEHYYVVHGVHRYLALKKVDTINRTRPVLGFPEDRSILCFILKVNSASLTNYINLKNNDLASEFQSSASNESLFFIYKGLLEATKDPNEAFEVVEKICHSRHLGPNELTVYRKVTAWPITVLDKLVSVLDLFQTFQTLDCKARGVKTKIRRRQPNTLTTTSFKQLGGCSPKFFMDNHVRVVGNQISLKKMLEESDKDNKKAKDELKVVACASGVNDLKTLQTKFPDKFSSESLKQFSGAEPEGRKRNEQGQRLKRYVKCVQLGITYKDPILIETFQHFGDITSEELEKFDVIVLNACKKNKEYIKCWIDCICCSLKEFYSVFLVLESQEDLVEVYQCLNQWKDKPDFKIHQCMFRKEKSVLNSDHINENGTFSILFGKVTIFKDKISILNDVINKDLKKLVSQVTPPGGKVAYVSKGDKRVVQIHQSNLVEEQSEVQFKYFVTESELAKVQDMFFIHAKVPVLTDKTRESKVSACELEEEEDTTDTESIDNETEADEEGKGDTDDSAESRIDLAKQSSTSSKNYF